MKKLCLLLTITLAICLNGCEKTENRSDAAKETVNQMNIADTIEEEDAYDDTVKIEFSNGEILVDGEKISENTESAVYKTNDIIFYLENQGISYGEGKKADEHSQVEADAHTVVNITEPGIYEISGTLEAGQIFVDLGDGTKNEEDAVATLILNNANITCTVAPAILFYRTYECAGDTDEETANMDADTTTAGANIVLADGSKNKIYGSYVAEIYEEYELSEDGTEVVDSKKLYKFDGAIYSRRSMNIIGTGKLDVVAENEGICSEMHLTMNGGDIHIKSGNDGVNVSEDNISVFTMNDGKLDIQVTGETGEGDGIDSNGWLVINGGEVNAFACATSMDSGMDADKGIYINGGTVAATGNMPAEIAEGKLNAITFHAKEKLEAGKKYQVKNAAGDVILDVSPKNASAMLVVAAEVIDVEDVYTLWQDDEELAIGFFGPGMMPEGNRPHMPEGMEPPKKPKQ